MILTMHGLTTMHCNMKTDIRIAKEAGYQALEITAAKLLRYLDTGLTAEELLPVFKSFGIKLNESIIYYFPSISKY